MNQEEIVRYHFWYIDPSGKIFEIRRCATRAAIKSARLNIPKVLRDEARWMIIEAVKDKYPHIMLDPKEIKWRRIRE